MNDILKTERNKAVSSQNAPVDEKSTTHIAVVTHSYDDTFILIDGSTREPLANWECEISIVEIDDNKKEKIIETKNVITDKNGYIGGDDTPGYYKYDVQYIIKIRPIAIFGGDIEPVAITAKSQSI